MRNKTKHTKINLCLDSVLLFTFLMLLFPLRTGLANHEWLGLAAGGTLVVHVLLHYKWIIAMTKKLSGKLPGKARTYYVLDAMLLVTFSAIIASGVLMSRFVLPTFGLFGTPSLALASIHKFTTYLTIALLVIKIALHGKWIAHTLKSFLPAQSRTKSTADISTTPAEASPEILSRQISRRRFLITGCGVACAAVLAGSCTLHQSLEEDKTPPMETADSDNVPVAEATEAGASDDAPVAEATETTDNGNTPVVEATKTADSDNAPVAETPQATSESDRNPTQRPATRCPHGMVNAPYPGRCHRYTDKNSNNICDLSETT